MGSRRRLLLATSLTLSWLGGCGRLGVQELPAVTSDQRADDGGQAQDASTARHDAGAGDIGDAGSAGDAGKSGNAGDAGNTRNARARTADAGAAGGGGGAKAPCPDPAPSALSDPLIDDLEDADGMIRAVDGRRGEWYTVNDGSRSGTQQPAPDAAFVPVSPGAQGSTYAARTWGNGFWTWGAALGLRLNATSSELLCRYDAATFSGLQFYARGSGTVTLSILTAATVPISAGGSCLANCFDYHAYRFALRNDWTLYEVAWNDLHQSGWGTAAFLREDELLGFEFAFGVAESFDLYLDDLRFF